MNKNLNVQFEIYDLNGEHLETLASPGDIGVWISSPYSPFEITILPIPFEKVKESDFKSELYRVIRTRLKDDLSEATDEKEEIIMVADYTMDESKELARKLGCDHFYFIHWDAERYITLYDIDEDEDALYAMSPDP